MADVNKQKLQLHPGLSTNGDKTSSSTTKLLINHGRPNFTIQRSPKVFNGNSSPQSPPAKVTDSNNNNGFMVKSTTFNGVFKPSNVSVVARQTLQQNGNTTISSSNGTDNEAAKVVLRKTKIAQPEVGEGEDDDNVPEFIRRQRRIQERLANQNILDFENRRSGYFTQVLISPSSPNRQSFVETMASPAIKPGLEIPPPITPNEDIKEETQQEQEREEQQHEQVEVEKCEEAVVHAAPVTLTGQDEEEEVAKAIEEVNKAVEGEDYDKTELEEQIETETQDSQTNVNIEPTVVAVTTLEHLKETKAEDEKPQEQSEAVAAKVTLLAVEEETSKNEKEDETLKVAEVPPTTAQNNHVEVVCKADKPNGIAETFTQNGHASNGDGITISHTNGLNGPTLPSPDPKGEKGVNFETKTVVSFSQELGNDINKYPDTIKVVKEVETLAADNELKELTKLKFEIKADDKDIEVKPVIIADSA